MSSMLSQLLRQEVSEKKASPRTGSDRRSRGQAGRGARVIHSRQVTVRCLKTDRYGAENVISQQLKFLRLILCFYFVF